MQKEKTYRECRFSAEALKGAIKVVGSIVGQAETESEPRYIMTVEVGDSKWHYDASEEFFADFRKDFEYSLFRVWHSHKISLDVTSYKRHVVVSMGALNHAGIESVFEVFEGHRDASKLEPVPESSGAPVVFIGHSHNPCWKELKDHLQEKHDIKVVSKEGVA